MARDQLGTVGSGNHYVDLFEDEDGLVWIGVHFGSRGLGHKTATAFIKAAGGKDGIDVAPTVLHQDSDLGRQYIAGMTLAGLYAYAGREWVVEKVRSIVGGEVLDSVHNHHNYAWRERHGERELWVVRKGATPAFPGQRGFVGGSMGDDAVILAGIESDDVGGEPLLDGARRRPRDVAHRSARALCQGPARPARRFASPAASATTRCRRGCATRACISSAATSTRRRRPIAACPDVLAQHAGTVRIEHTLRPFAVVMAGADVFDPFKD